MSKLEEEPFYLECLKNSHPQQRNKKRGAIENMQTIFELHLQGFEDNEEGIISLPSYLLLWRLQPVCN